MNTINKLKVLEGLGLKQLKEKLIRQPRARMWDAIRKSPDDFTLLAVVAAAKMNKFAGRDYLSGLVRAGFVTEIYRQHEALCAVGNAKVVHYKLVKDVGNEAPAVDRSGKILKPRAVNQAMWNTLRICGAVTTRQLAELASTDEIKVSAETAKSYLQDLRAAGYVAQVTESNHKRQASYRLLANKNTGPKPPQVTRAARVFDPNIGEVVYQEMPEFTAELRDGLLDEDDISNNEVTAEGSQS